MKKLKCPECEHEKILYVKQSEVRYIDRFETNVDGDELDKVDNDEEYSDDIYTYECANCGWNMDATTEDAIDYFVVDE